MKRHAFICVGQAIGVVISLYLFGPGSAATAAELTPFRVGEAASANTFPAIRMAELAGFYQAQGLQLEVVHMVRDSESGPRAGGSGRADATRDKLAPCTGKVMVRRRGIESPACRDDR